MVVLYLPVGMQFTMHILMQQDMWAIRPVVAAWVVTSKVATVH